MAAPEIFVQPPTPGTTPKNTPRRKSKGRRRSSLAVQSEQKSTPPQSATKTRAKRMQTPLRRAIENRMKVKKSESYEEEEDMTLHLSQLGEGDDDYMEEVEEKVEEFEEEEDMTVHMSQLGEGDEEYMDEVEEVAEEESAMEVEEPVVEETSSTRRGRSTQKKVLKPREPEERLDVKSLKVCGDRK